jgi:DNA polymerase-1
MTRKRLFVIDGFSQIFRSFYAIKHIDNNAVYGFMTMLRALVRDEQPDYLIVAFDSPGPTFRHDLYPAYKQNRSAPPEDLVRQIPLVLEGLQAMEIPTLRLDGFEADDLIGSLATQWASPELQLIMVSADKDLLQLVRGEDVLFFNPSKNNLLLTEKDVPDFFGVRADQIIDLLTLWGDSSDNIPGAKGIGEKGAKQLLQEFGDLKTLFQQLDRIKSKSQQAKLREAESHLPLFRELVTIRTDLHIPFDLSSCQCPPWDQESFQRKARPFFQKLAFHSLVTEAPQEVTSRSATFGFIEDPTLLETCLNEIETTGRFFFDLETTALDCRTAEIVGISLCWAEDKVLYVPLRHQGYDPSNTKDLETLLQRLFQNPSLEKCAHNAKFDTSVLLGRGWTLAEPVNDTLLMSYLLEPRENRHGLDELAERLFHYRTEHFEDICGTGKDAISFDHVPLEQAANYAGEDAWIGWRLWQHFVPELRKNGLWDLYVTLERPLMSVIRDMESTGIVIDCDSLARLSHDFNQALTQTSEVIFRLAGTEFNLNSTQQLGQILFETLLLPPLGKTSKTKQHRTSQEVLEQLSFQGFEIADHLLVYRQKKKLLSTYIEALPLQVHPHTGRIHSSFNQALTETGRLSSHDPNLQNIPIKTESGAQIRACFLSGPGKKLLVADYSQIELRLLAHFSGDAVLKQAFKEGEDIHQRTASEIFGIPLTAVHEDQRRMAKSINFGLIYGMGAFRLAQELGISRQEAAQYIDLYFQKMPRVIAWKEEILAQCRKNKGVRTLFGRWRPIEELASRNKNLVSRGERLAINTLIQGTAADLLKKAMIDFHQLTRQRGLEASILIQVHDELVVECREDQAQETFRHLIRCMEHVLPLTVPLVCQGGIGDNWRDAKP